MSEDAPEGLESTFAMLRSAYPSGLPDADYIPLLRVLSEEMSERALGTIIALLFDREAVVVQNDSAAVQSGGQPAVADVDRVRRHLQEHGYDAWVDGDNFDASL